MNYSHFYTPILFLIDYVIQMLTMSTVNVGTPTAEPLYLRTLSDKELVESLESLGGNEP